MSSWLKNSWPSILIPFHNLHFVSLRVAKGDYFTAADCGDGLEEKFNAQFLQPFVGGFEISHAKSEMAHSMLESGHIGCIGTFIPDWHELNHRSAIGVAFETDDD